MGWATSYITLLKLGKTVEFRPRGSSMQGRISTGDLCIVEPAKLHSIEPGDIVLCKVNGREYLHLVKAVRGEQYQIANNRGHINGWISLHAIFGKCVMVEGKPLAGSSNPLNTSSKS
jgi:SOS-response transcriptional repressor LexA